MYNPFRPRVRPDPIRAKAIEWYRTHQDTVGWALYSLAICEYEDSVHRVAAEVLSRRDLKLPPMKPMSDEEELRFLKREFDIKQ